MNGFPQVGYLRPLVKNPNIVVGDYTYCDDPDGPENFERDRMRFDEGTVNRLLAIAWWNWPAEKISRNLERIVGADISALENAA